MYVIGANTPGYLPEDDDPFTTDDLTTARQALAAEIERDWDSEYELSESDVDRSAIDSRYLDAHASVNTMTVGESVYVPAPEWQTHGLGRVYFIAETEA